MKIKKMFTSLKKNKIKNFKKKLYIIFYFILSFFYIICVIEHLKSIEIYIKPFLFASIIYYYIKKMKFNISKLAIINLFLFYIAEMLVLIDDYEFYLYNLLLFLIAYIIYLFQIYKQKSKQIIIKKIYFAIPFILLLLSIMQFIKLELTLEFIFILSISITLLLISTLSVVYFSLENSVLNLYMLFTSICFLISDLFYFFYEKIFTFQIFLLINLITQVFSYYFYVKYVIIKNK